MQAQAPALSIRRVSPEGNAAALALAAQAWPPSERPGQLAALAQLVRSGQSDSLVLIAAYRGDRLCGAVLAQVLVGKAAVVWPPQLAASAHVAIAQQLLDELRLELSELDVCLGQAVLESPSSAGALALETAGYVQAGDLAYLAADAATFPSAPPVLEFGLVAAASSEPERLARVVEVTYRGSLDCPLVDGLRPTAEVLAGYRAVGQHRADWWLIAREQTARGEFRDLGCLLLADHPPQDQVEIVYLGIVPECRGRRWGLALARQAQWLARAAGRSRVVLAVDAANRPAIRAYESAGFVGWDRRSVFIADFRRTAKPATAST
jgi:ribosomal protein S18 acetylase RimI-like enzyme